MSDEEIELGQNIEPHISWENLQEYGKQLVVMEGSKTVNCSQCMFWRKAYGVRKLECELYAIGLFEEAHKIGSSIWRNARLLCQGGSQSGSNKSDWVVVWETIIMEREQCVPAHRVVWTELIWGWSEIRSDHNKNTLIICCRRTVEGINNNEGTRTVCASAAHSAYYTEVIGCWSLSRSDNNNWA